MGDILRGSQNGDRFGYDVSISLNGKMVAVGARSYNGEAGSDTGLVQVFDFNNSHWTQHGHNIEGEKAGDSLFANALSDDGDILAVGAHYNGDNGNQSGHVRVYQFNSTIADWQPKGNKIVGLAAYDWFGRTVALSGNGKILAVGAYRAGSYTGQVRVFYWNWDLSWVNKGDPLNGTSTNDYFGYSISLSEDGHILAVGAYGNDDKGHNSGSVQVWEFRDSNWNWHPLGRELFGLNEDDEFGWSVSLSSNGHTAAIGARHADPNGISNSGQVRLYQFNEDGQEWELLAPSLTGNSASDYFGYSVSLSGDASVLAVGAPQEDANSVSKGLLRIFQQDGIMNWQEFVIEIAHPQEDDNLGRAVAVSRDGSTVVAGGDAYSTGHPGLAIVVQLKDSCPTTGSTADPTPSPSLHPTEGLTTGPSESPTVAPTASPTRSASLGTPVKASFANIVLSFQNAGKLTKLELQKFETVTKTWFEEYFVSSRQQDILDMVTEILVVQQEVEAHGDQVFFVNTITYDQTVEYVALHGAQDPEYYIFSPFIDKDANEEFARILAEEFDAFQGVQTPIPVPKFTVPPSKSSTGLVVGLLIACLVILGLCVIGGLYYRHRAKQRTAIDADDPALQTQSTNQDTDDPLHIQPQNPNPRTVTAHVVNIEAGVHMDDMPSNIPLVNVPTPAASALAGGSSTDEVPKAAVDPSSDIHPTFKDQANSVYLPRAHRVPPQEP